MLITVWKLSLHIFNGLGKQNISTMLYAGPFIFQAILMFASCNCAYKSEVLLANFVVNVNCLDGITICTYSLTIMCTHKDIYVT